MRGCKQAVQLLSQKAEGLFAEWRDEANTTPDEEFVQLLSPK